MLSSLRIRPLLLAAGAALLACSAALAYSGSASVTHPTGQHVDCRDFGYATGGVFGNFGLNGVYSTDHSGVQQAVTVTISNYTAGQGSVPARFNWSSTAPISQVYVQAGSTSNPQNMYTYSPGATSDAGMESPKPSISHVLFCFSAPPTAVAVESFAARRGARGIALEWRTATEVGNAGFHVYRQVGSTRVKITARLIPAGAGVPGALHRFVDHAVARPGTRYWLQGVSPSGVRSWLASTIV